MHVYAWIFQPHFNLTRLSVEEWVCVQIKLPGIADGEEVRTVCGRRCFCIWENKKKKKRRRRNETKEKKEKREEEEEEGEDWR